MSGWIRQTLETAKQSHLCAKIICTTCGAIPFQKLLIRQLVSGSSETLDLKIFGNDFDQLRLIKNFLMHNQVALSELISELKNLSEPEFDEFGEYLRYILVVLYQDELIINHEEFEYNIEGTQIGFLLYKMKQHHQKRLEFKKIEYIRNDPELARLRREQKKAERAIAHQKRHGC